MREKLFSFLDKSESLAVELETELCKYPAISPDSGGKGELDKCLFLESWLKARGITRLERFDAPDSRAEGGVRPNLVATLPASGGATSGGAGRRLWIMSHLDVVPPGEISLWKSDPWTLVRKENGRRPDGSPIGPHLIGRGVEDNQQGLVSSVLAALALVQQGIAPGREVKLLFVSDEENGSAYGIGWLLRSHRDLFRESDMVLIPDSGDSGGESVEIAEKNLVWARFVTKGRQSHGSRPDLGNNAFLAGAGLALKLHSGLLAKFDGQDPLFDPPYSTFEPTKKEANVPNINTIPGEDVFCMDMRILPRYRVNMVMEEVRRITAEVEKEYGVKITNELSQNMESRPTPADAPLVKLLSQIIAEVYAVKARPVGIGGGTVGAYLRNEGIDSVVWCRIDDTAHQPNEYALVENIIGDAKVMALLMTRSFE
jgi:succinyl-diaminopimelate desuccinylase